MSRRSAWLWVLCAHSAVLVVGIAELRLLNVPRAKEYEHTPPQIIGFIVTVFVVVPTIILAVWLLVSAMRDPERNSVLAQRLIMTASICAAAVSSLAAIASVLSSFGPTGVGVFEAIWWVVAAFVALVPIPIRRRRFPTLVTATVLAIGMIPIAAYLVVGAPLLIAYATLQLMVVSSTAFGEPAEN